MMPPSVGVGGCTPSPRKLIADSATTICATWKLEMTSSAGTTFGSMWRPMMRASPAPIARTACTNSCSFRDMTRARTRRQ